MSPLVRSKDFEIEYCLVLYIVKVISASGKKFRNETKRLFGFRPKEVDPMTITVSQNQTQTRSLHLQ